MKQIVFACGTEYHLLMAFVLASTTYREREKVLLVHLDPRSQVYVDRIRQLDLWDEVVVVNSEYEIDAFRDSLPNLVQRAAGLHFFSWGYPEFNILFDQCAEKGVPIYLTDEGLLTYSPIRRYAAWLAQHPNHAPLVAGFDMEKIDEIWVCAPELFLEQRQWPVQKIPIESFIQLCKQDARVFGQFTSLYDLPDDFHLQADVAYFRQYFGSIGILPAEVDRWLDSVFVQGLQTANLIIKNHPSEKQPGYLAAGGGFAGADLPWEVVVLLAQICSSEAIQLPKVFVSLTSSAMVKTAILGVKGSYLFLTRIMEQYALWKDETVDAFISRLVEQYPESRFYAPDNWQELGAVVQEIAEREQVSISSGSLPSQLDEEDRLREFYLSNWRSLRTAREQLKKRDQRLTAQHAQIESLERNSRLLHDQYTRKLQDLEARNEQQASQAKRQVARLEEELAALKTHQGQREVILQDLNNKLLEIYSSTAWAIVQGMWRLRLALAPKGSARERWVHSLLSWPRALLRRPGAPAQAGGTGADKPAAEAGAPKPYPQDYFDLLSTIQTRSREERQAYVVEQPPGLVQIDGHALISAAMALQVPSYEQPRISIVIPVYNGARFLLECLYSIVDRCDRDPAGYEIIVVDDCSDGETQEILRRIANVRVIRNEERQGFSISCNAGAAQARGQYVLITNSDVQFASNDFLTHLTEPFVEFEQAGIVGPKIIYPAGQLQEAGALINRDGTTTMIGYGDDPALPRYNYTREVDYCSGVCLLIPKDLFDALGGFDTGYSPAYCEDVDLCLRVRQRGKKIYYNPRGVVVHHLSATTKTLGSSFKYDLISRNRLKLLRRWQEEIDAMNQVKLIAFYLPQFHAIPENDLWWGKGFTEWRNVTRAKPVFEGHRQPRKPADLGYYDLNTVEVMEAQASLAKEAGIEGFCYYYYWFNGKRLLEMPLERMLETGRPDFPFCLCWANENWTARWDGGNNEILIGQQHSDEDDRRVMQDLIRYFRHPNYIRIENRPVILVYRVTLFPNFKRTAEIWRAVCQEEGIPGPHIVMVESFEFSLETIRPEQYGADAAVEFPPHGDWQTITPPGAMLDPEYRGRIVDYDAVALKYALEAFPEHIVYKTVMPSWDNTARNQSASTIYYGATPGKYQAWLEHTIRLTREQYAGEHRLVFINAWNEWAEGNYLEPDAENGYHYLSSTRNAVDQWMLKPDRGLE